MPIKRFLYRILIFTPVLLLMILVNYYIDPGNLFGDNQYVHQLSFHLASGKNLLAPDPNYDERLKQIYVIQYMKKPKDILVFGSSRCKGIHQGLFPGKTFYNAGVSAGSLEDFIGLYQLFYENNLLPKTLILELSAWILNPENEQLHGDVTTIMPVYKRALSRFKMPVENTTPYDNYNYTDKIQEKLKQLLSPYYFQQSLKKFYKYARIKKAPSQFGFRFANKIIANELILFSDGSWVSSEEHRIVTKTEALKHATMPKGLQRFTKFNMDRIKEFEVFIQQMINDGIEIVFYLPPWPTLTYQKLVNSEKYNIVVNEEEYFRSFAKRYGIKVIGSYNADNLGYSLDDFADSAHLRRSAVAKMFK